MTGLDFASLQDTWFPVAVSREVERRAISHAKLLGQELAIWRADDGQINAWENRCVHRSVRLTIGQNRGAELQCQYHGWRYASGSGQCTRIPARPNLTPAQSIRIRNFPVHEKHGFVWTSLGSPLREPHLAPLSGTPALMLRSLPFNVSPGTLGDALMEYSFAHFGRPAGHDTEPAASVTRLGPLTFHVESPGAVHSESAILLVQPVQRDKAVVHGCLVACDATMPVLAILRRCNDALTELRRRLETAAIA